MYWSTQNTQHPIHWREWRPYSRIRETLLFVAFFLASHSATAICPTFGLPDGSEIVELQTTEGQICIQLLRDDAPSTVSNFVQYVIDDDYDGTIIHRSAPGFVIQGGAYRKTSDSLIVVPTDPAIPNEPCTIEPGDSFCLERGNDVGTVAMARIGGQVNSATNQFFINLADNRISLDNTDEGFTVFGRVLGTGMTIVNDIAVLPIVEPDHAWWLAPDIGSNLNNVPVANLVPLFPTAFGCWDPTNLAVVVSPTSHTTPLPFDPIIAGEFFPLSGSCGTQIPRFTFTEDPGPPGCPDLDRLTTAVTGMTTLQILADPATSDFLQFEFTCPEVEEALNQRTLWRADFGARLAPQLVEVLSAEYQYVPEPGVPAALIAGTLALSSWARTRRKDAHAEPS